MEGEGQGKGGVAGGAGGGPAVVAELKVGAISSTAVELISLLYLTH